MSSGKQPFSEEGYALMGAAFEVHNEIGGGLAEEIYQQSLEIELELRGIPFRVRQELKVFYKNRELSKRYIPDLVGYEKIVVELKSVSALLPEHEGQLINYMRISKSPVGYLINFGPIGKLEYKRFILSEFL
ncbi:MAG: GxxExxY protein [Planctomycetota bacterium]|nr:GxxExxY protein [Planctomycetota bacterium]